MESGIAMQFQGTIELSGKTSTGFQVPDDVVSALGAGKRPAVRVTINGYPYRSTIASMGGRFMLPVSAEIREHAGVAAGDVVDVELVLDTEPREVEMPPDFATALDADIDARQFFDGLSFSKKRWFVENIKGAKTAETRERRISNAVSQLRERIAPR